MNVLLKEISSINEAFTKTDSVTVGSSSSNINKQNNTPETTTASNLTSSNNIASSTPTRITTTTTSVLKDVKKESTSSGNSDGETYCICKKTFDSDEDDMMIECDVCKNWFHGK